MKDDLRITVALATIPADPSELALVQLVKALKGFPNAAGQIKHLMNRRDSLERGLDRVRKALAEK